MSAEPVPLYPSTSKTHEECVPVGLESSTHGQGLLDLEELPVRSYRVKLADMTPPSSWKIGCLAKLNGPAGTVSFADLWSDLVHPTDREELSEVYQQILDNQSTQWRVRFRWLANSTSILHVGAYDKKKGIVKGILLDVTESPEVRARQIESEKMSAMGLMTAGVAHDFNNLLSAILSFAGLALEDLPKESETWNDINEVVKAAKRAEALTRQLLTFSQVKGTSVGQVDVRERLAELYTILSRLLGETIHLSINTSPRPAVVRVDPVQFDQIVLNLALNARDAMMPHGGRLGISLESKEDDDNTVRLRIQDTGRGMDSDTMERIFEPFFTTKPKGRGTGLGLATCFAIVNRTGGQISVESSLGEGTAFVVSWPLVRSLSEDGAQ